MIFATCGNVLTIIALLGPMSSAVIGRVRQTQDVQARRALQEGAVRAERRSPDTCYALPVSNAAIRKCDRTNRSCFQAVTQSFITPTCLLLKMRALISGWLCLFCSTVAAAAFSFSCIQDISPLSRCGIIFFLSCQFCYAFSSFFFFFGANLEKVQNSKAFDSVLGKQP